MNLTKQYRKAANEMVRKNRHGEISGADFQDVMLDLHQGYVGDLHKRCVLFIKENPQIKPAFELGPKQKNLGDACMNKDAKRLVSAIKKREPVNKNVISEVLNDFVRVSLAKTHGLQTTEWPGGKKTISFVPAP